MQLDTWFAFALASMVVLAIPGPTILTILGYSFAHGRKAFAPVLAAIALGDSTAVALSIFGLGALLANSEQWFLILKSAGGIYLLYLAWQLFKARQGNLEISAENTATESRSIFINTYLITAFNPKGIVFLVAFLPQFIDYSEPSTPQLWTVSITFVSLALINSLVYLCFATSAKSLISSGNVHRNFHIIGATALAIAGIWALLSQAS